MFGLGKRRSRIGKFLDKRGISQEWLVKESGVGRTTISSICSSDDYMPSGKTIRKVIKALQKIDADITASDFFFNE